MRVHHALESGVSQAAQAHARPWAKYPSGPRSPARRSFALASTPSQAPLTRVRVSSCLWGVNTRAFQHCFFHTCKARQRRERRSYVAGRAAMRAEGVWSEPAGKKQVDAGQQRCPGWRRRHVWTQHAITSAGVPCKRWRCSPGEGGGMGSPSQPAATAPPALKSTLIISQPVSRQRVGRRQPRPPASTAAPPLRTLLTNAQPMLAPSPAGAGSCRPPPSGAAGLPALAGAAGPHRTPPVCRPRGWGQAQAAGAAPPIRHRPPPPALQELPRQGPAPGEPLGSTSQIHALLLAHACQRRRLRAARRSAVCHRAMPALTNAVNGCRLASFCPPLYA